MAGYIDPTRCALPSRLLHDDLIVRRPGGMAPGVNHERPMAGDFAFIAEDRLFVQGFFRQIPVHFAQIVQP